MEDRRRILIVEDSETQALKLDHVLRQQGWDVVWAASAEFAARVPDLILVDYYLPGIRGDELCRRIRLHLNTRSIPIIILTAEESGALEVQGLESGADDFVQKSADPGILILRIRTLLKKSESYVALMEPPDAIFRRARLLTIDDSETYLQFLSEELKCEGYQIDRSSDAADGLARLAAQRYDCVLVDLVMPGMDGIQVCREISRLRQRMNAPIAVLMLTGKESQKDLTRALEAGADDFVGKSNDMAVLKGRIRALLRRNFYQEENQRNLEELKNKELEAVRTKAEREAADAQAELARQREALKIMSELEQTKEQLERSNAELRRSNDELQQFAYVASHDLQEPLRSVGSFCDLLLQEYQSKFDAQGARWLEKIGKGVRRMKTMIQDLLSYSRVQQQGQPFEPTDLTSVCDEAIGNLRTAIRDAEAVVTRDTLPVLPVDPTQILHLLQNLIGNAVKYHGKEQPLVHVSASGRGDEWEISVRDNGIGIDPKFHRRIFEIFKRLHGKDQYPGTGIGLALCHRIVHRHGGRIWVESEEGKGSTFRFTLAATAAALSPGPETADSHGTETGRDDRDASSVGAECSASGTR
jgi:signal transduction histidine kinase